MKISQLLFAVLMAPSALSAKPQTPAKIYKAPQTLLSYVDILSAQGSKTSNDFIEKGSSNILSQDKKRYITPFSEAAQHALVKAFIERERARRSSAGVIVNIALSAREVLGYSEVARLQSAQEIGIDPIDLNIENKAEDRTDTYIEKWLAWRRAKLLSLVRKIAISYKANFKSRRIYISGDANYYRMSWFNDLRSGQDWKSWLKTGLFDGAVIRGNWDERNGDPKAFQLAWQELQRTKASPSGKRYMGVELCPLFASLPKTVSFNRQCATLLRRVPNLAGIFAYQSSSKSYSKFTNYKNSLTLPQYRAPQIGELNDQWPLSRPDESYIDRDSHFGKREMALLLAPEGIDDKVLQILDATATNHRKVSIVTSINPSKIKATPQISQSLLIDKNRQLINLYPKRRTLLLFDSAGFLRYVGLDPIPTSIPASVTTICRVGEPAPDFQLPDMNGEVRRLSSLRGKKNILLTFFPKCFTGGCTNHLTSIRDVRAKFAEADTEVWAISVDPANVQVPFSARWNLGFTLIPDPGRNLCFLFGAVRTQEDLADRMSVLIDKEGIVRWIDRDVHIPSHGSDILVKMKDIGMVH